jgi:ribonuclease III
MKHENLEQRYEKLQEEIGIKFKEMELLDTAFVHKSYVNEHRDVKMQHNERIEFLGDAVLELVVTEFLYKGYPSKGEGILTNWRSALVKGKHLAEIAEQLNLGVYIYLSKGEEKSGGRKKHLILANILESLIGAIYLDHNYKTAHKFIEKFILARLTSILEQGLHIDAKSRFQEISQDKLGLTPEYKVIKEDGPDHSKTFMMGVYLKDELIGQGEGSSKQSAEQKAAQDALRAKNWH